MSNINAKYTHKMQATTKPKPEELINELLTGERKGNALSFIAWLRDNKFSPSWNTSNGWRVNCKGKPLCYITVGKSPVNNNMADTWNVNPITHEKHSGDDGNHPLCSDKVKEVAWSSLRICEACSKCKGGRNILVFGKEIKGVCHGIHYGGQIDPDTETLECVKKIILMSKEAIGYNFIAGKV